MNAAERARARRAEVMRGQVYHGPDPVPDRVVRALMRVSAAVARAKKRGAMWSADHAVIVRTAPAPKSHAFAGPSTWAIAILHNGKWFNRVTRAHHSALIAAFVREIDGLQRWTRGRA